MKMNKTSLIIPILLMTVVCPASADQNDRNCYPITAKELTLANAPRFAQYYVKTEKLKKAAKVNLNSHPKARRYRTVLRLGAEEGPNFAGHYAVVGWGCGTSCVMFAIVDLKSGSVIFPNDFTTVTGLHFEADEFEKAGSGPFWGLRYKLDSRLLVVVGMLNEDTRREGAYYYLIEKSKLKRIFSVVVVKDDCDNRIEN
jgi:hypothetical protein